MNLEKKVLSQFFRSAKLLCGKNALSVLNTVHVRMDATALHLKVNQLTIALKADIPFRTQDAFPLGESFILTERLYPITALVVAASAKKGKYTEVAIYDDFLYINDTKITPSGLDVDMFPEIDFPDNEVEFLGKIKKFDNMVEAQDFVSADETRYFMNGIYFEIVKGHVRIVATDGRVLYKSDVTFGNAESIRPGLDDDVQGYIVRDFSKHFHLRLERFQFGTRCVKFYDDVFSLYVVLIDGQFPNYERVIPDTAPMRLWVFDLDAYKDAFEKLTIQARMHGLKRDGKLRTVLHDRTMYVAHADRDKVFSSIGDGVVFPSSIPDDAYISFNLGYTKMILNTGPTSDFYIDADNPEMRALIIKDNAKESTKVFMPMQVKD